MRNLILLILFILIISLPSEAYEIQQYNLHFTITKDLTVNEVLEISFSEVLNQTTLSYIVLNDISEIHINNTEKELDYTVNKTGEEYRISFTMPPGTEKLFISFKTRGLIFSYGKILQFFTLFKPPQELKIVSISLALPQGHIVYRDIVSPRGANMTTDGERIYIQWKFKNLVDEVPISVQFYNPYESDIILIIVPPFFICILIIFNYYREKTRKEFLKGFSEDEKKVIEILMKKKVSYQNKIRKELKFSKAKISRICRKLESKNLIERKKIGKKKKIFWKK
jgi:uncharacterized membrane protein